MRGVGLSVLKACSYIFLPNMCLCVASEVTLLEIPPCQTCNVWCCIVLVYVQCKLARSRSCWLLTRGYCSGSRTSCCPFRCSDNVVFGLPRAALRSKLRSSFCPFSAVVVSVEMATEALKRPYDAFGGAVVPAAKRPRQEVVLAQRNAGALIPSVCILHGIEGPAESSIEKAQLLSFSLSAGSAKDVGSACSCYAVDRARGRHQL